MTVSEKPLLRALRGMPSAIPPVWLMRQAGRYLPEYRSVRQTAGSFLDLCFTPPLAVEVTLQPIRRYGFDAAILFSDILVICHALGQKVSFVEGEGPRLEPVRIRSDIESLSDGSVIEHLAPVYDTVRGVRAGLDDKTTLIGFAGAPWTVATYMVEGGSSREFLAVKTLAFGESELFSRLIDRLVQATGDHLIAQIDRGAEAVKLFDSWAGVLPEDAFLRWVVEPTAVIVERVHRERPGVPVIGFPRGCGALYRLYAERTGVDGLTLDTGVPLDWAVETLAPHATLQGNLDPLLLAVGGPALDAAIDRIVAACRDVPFIFNLGHGVIPSTPPENVTRLVTRLRERA